MSGSMNFNVIECKHDIANTAFLLLLNFDVDYILCLVS